MTASRPLLRLSLFLFLIFSLFTSVFTAAALVTARALPWGWVLLVAVRQNERSRDQYNDLYLIDVQHCRQHALDILSLDDALAWSPDGERIAYISTATGGFELHVSDWRGVSDQQVTFGLGRISHPAWSPRSDQIVFTVSNRDQFDIFRLNLDEKSVPVALTGADTVDVAPDFAPDGTRLVYSGSWGATFHLHTLDLITGTVERINDTDDDRWAFDPTYSPDGSQIAYITNNSSFDDYRLHILNADGTNPRMIAQAGLRTQINKPAFSPDGGSIAVIYTPERGATLLYAVNTDGIGWHRIPCTPDRIAAFAFRPF